MLEMAPVRGRAGTVLHGIALAIFLCGRDSLRRNESR